MRRVIALVLLTACAATPQAVTKSDTADALTLVPTIVFPATPGLPPQRSNAQMAQDFLDLEFHMESGLALPILTRFDLPVTVALTGAIPATAATDLHVLLSRLHTEAGLDLTPVAANAAITLNFVPRATLRRIEPSAACFVIPNVSSLAEYRAKRGSADLDWEALTQRRRAAIFLPADASPQEVRDCLHEELAQALGPLNDLYRLPDSVFNDDNFQSVLTGFDMLMLRLHYSPDLANGMTEPQVAARLPALLARLNPAGEAGSGWPAAATPRPYIDAVATALGPDTAAAARLPAASQMLIIALAQGWQDNRSGFASFVLGRLQAPHDPAAALQSYTSAARIFASLPDGGVHLSHAKMQLAAIALASGHPETAITLVDQTLPLASRAQNAALMATLMLIKSQSLLTLGRTAEAQALRLDSLPAARYGFGIAPEIRARAADIAALALHRRN